MCCNSLENTTRMVVVMHDMRLIHTDLKPENILLVSIEYVKVPDHKVSSRSPRDGSYFKKLPKSSAIKGLDGAICVTYGALAVSLWSYARGKHCFRLMKTWSTWP